MTPMKLRTWFTEGPLRRGLTLRLALVLLIALVALSGAVIVVAERAEHADAVRDVDEAVSTLEQRVRSLQSGWMSQADVLRAQIDFARALDQPEARQRDATLSAFFATLGGEGIFTHAALMDADGRVLWRYRTRSQEDLTPPDRGSVLGWVFGDRDATLYRAIGQRVLVAGKAAQLWLFVPLDNGLLEANTPPETAVELHWRDRVLIRYRTADAIETPSADGADHPLRMLRWPGDPSGPELAIRRYTAPPINLPQALSIAALAGAAVAVLGWAVLVLWLTRHARQLGSLQSAAQGFKKVQRMHQAVVAALDSAAIGSSAELRGLAVDMRAMMQGLEASQRQQLDSQHALAELNANLEQRVEQRTQELAQSRDAALAGARAKEQFLATMSHELRTPLSGMLGSLEVLDDRSLQPSQAEMLGIARSSGQALLGIINEVLDFSKTESGRIDLALAPFRPAELLDEVARLFRAGAARKGVQLRCDCEGPDAALLVVGDAARLRQVLLNLTANAVNFTSRGSVTLSLRRTDGGGPVAHLQFEVIDTGPGIAATDVQRIFQPFEQVATGNQGTAAGGTGLGLAISDRLVAAMGGRLAVQSTVGVGSRFHFELEMPVAQPGRAEAAQSRQAVMPAEELGALQGTVLVVDDNVVNRIVATQMLQHLGLRVLECEDGRQACDMIDTQPIDAVLMDCLMPGMDGYEATRGIRARQVQRGVARVPIIALTANVMPGDAQRCLEAGMDAYLAKPFTRQQLQAALRPWLHPVDANVA